MANPEAFPVESDLVEAMRRADSAYLAEIIERYPAGETAGTSRIGTAPGEYWGLACAVALRKLGLDVGFVADARSDSGDVTFTGSHEAINHWLTLTNYELRTRHNLAHSESRSGLFTLMECPVHSQLFEHMYAAYTGTDLDDIMAKDPMYEGVRSRQAASDFERTDHEGFMRLYDENRDHTIRLYLTRQSPYLKHLRSAIETTRPHLDTSGFEPTDDMDERTKKMLLKIKQEREEFIPFERARIERWQTEYDFTTSLLMQGYRPYNLEEVVSFAEDYIIGLLATKPEFSPTQPTAEIPDMKANILKLLRELEQRSGDSG